jgi:hypothetical protein
MAVSRLSQQSIQQAFPKGNTFWDGTTATSAFDSLGTVVLAADAANVTFSNIPQTYTHLQVRLTARGTFASAGLSVLLGLSGNTELSGFRHHIYGNGSSASGYGATGAYGIIGGTPGSTVTSTVWGASIIDVLDYTNTNKTKTLRAISGWDANGSGEVVFASSYTPLTTAITSIKLVTDGNWASGSQITLYGIK